MQYEYSVLGNTLYVIQTMYNSVYTEQITRMVESNDEKGRVKFTSKRTLLAKSCARNVQCVRDRHRSSERRCGGCV